MVFLSSFYGPDANGNLVKLTPSYQLKSGNRPGDGISACGPCNGKYYNDFEYIANLGDLDACMVFKEISVLILYGHSSFRTLSLQAF